MKRLNRFFLFAILIALMLPVFGLRAQAADLDRILDYEISVNVNQDGTLDLVYHIEWKVLDSTTDGALTWVKVGIPNKHYVSMKGLTSTVKSIKYLSDGGSYVRIDLDKAYYENEVVTFEFELVQDYTYQMDQFVEGETVYGFTPGWFPDCKIDKMAVYWNTDKVLRTDPAADKKARLTPAGCIIESEYYVFTKENLKNGEKLPIQVIYPNDAFSFDPAKMNRQSKEPSGGLVAFLVIVIIFGVFGFIIVLALILDSYDNTAGLSAGTKKITRTRIEYFPSCPGCGGARPDDANNCPFCGRSFIKSEEIIKEEDIPKEEKALKKKKTNGLYPYSSSPNTYMLVHVTHVPRPRPSSYSSTTRSHCAHSSCACACACACAGGGRAGCSTKDFYNTNLKLRQLELKEKQ